MAIARYLALIAGKTREVIATVVSFGAADDGKIVALDASGRLDATVMPVGIGADVASLQASETIGSSRLVSSHNSGGPRVRNADATAAGKEALGFVIAGIATGTSGTVYFEGRLTGLSGLTPGARYYTSTTPGAVTDTAPTGSGNVVQFIGIAIDDNSIAFEASDGIILA